MSTTSTFARILLFLVIFCSVAAGQSEYLGKKEQATTLEIGLDRSGDAVGVAGAAGFSLFSRADLGFEIGRLGVSSVTVWAFGPTADLYLLKNGADDFPISIGVNGSILNYTANDPTSDAVWQHTLGAFVTRRFPLSPEVWVVPRFGIGSTGFSHSNLESFKSAGIGLCGRRGRARVIINLSVSWYKSETDVMISVGTLLFNGPNQASNAPDNTPFSN